MVELVQPKSVREQAGENTLYTLVLCDFYQCSKTHLIISKEQECRQAGNVDAQPERSTSTKYRPHDGKACIR